jgi:hypothetical protein
MEIRLKASHPDFLEVDFLNHLHHVLLNQHVHFDTQQEPITDPELYAAIANVRLLLQHELDGIDLDASMSAFTNYVGGMSCDLSQKE